MNFLNSVAGSRLGPANTIQECHNELDPSAPYHLPASRGARPYPETQVPGTATRTQQVTGQLPSELFQLQQGAGQRFNDPMSRSACAVDRDRMRPTEWRQSLSVCSPGGRLGPRAAVDRLDRAAFHLSNSPPLGCETPTPQHQAVPHPETQVSGSLAKKQTDSKGQWPSGHSQWPPGEESRMLLRDGITRDDDRKGHAPCPDPALGPAHRLIPPSAQLSQRWPEMQVAGQEALGRKISQQHLSDTPTRPNQDAIPCSPEAQAQARLGPSQQPRQAQGLSEARDEHHRQRLSAAHEGVSSFEVPAQARTSGGVASNPVLPQFCDRLLGELCQVSRPPGPTPRSLDSPACQLMDSEPQWAVSYTHLRAHET